MVGEFDPDKTESRNELCWRRNSLLADSQRHPARLPDRCCCCSSRHPLPRVRARACCRRSIARVRLLDHEKVGLPSLNPLRHSCRRPRLRHPLQPYRRSPLSPAAPSRIIRLPNLMPKIVLADNRDIIQRNNGSLYVLGDNLSRVSRHIFISVAPTVPQLSRIFNDVEVHVQERFLQDSVRGLRKSPASKNRLRIPLRVVEHLCTLGAAT